MNQNSKKRIQEIDLIKWGALAFMILSHVIKAQGPEIPLVLLWFSYAGFPVFAFAFAYTSKATVSQGRINTLLLWACVAQVPYSMVFPGFRLNIMFSFLVSSLPLRYSIPIAIALGPFFDGTTMGIFMLIFARHAKMPPLPQLKLPFKVPHANLGMQIYAGHLVLLAAYQQMM